MLNPPFMGPTLRVAIYRTSSLGDVVLASACLDLLSRLSVPAEITWIGRGAALEVIKNAWPMVKTVALNKSQSMAELQRLVASLANMHIFIDLQCNIRSRWISRTLKINHHVPFFEADKDQIGRGRKILEARVRGRRRPLPETALFVQRRQYEMMCGALVAGLEHHLPVEMREGLSGDRARPRLPIPEIIDPPWRKELRFGLWLGVAPGAAHPTKQAPLDLVQAIIQRIGERLGTSDGQQAGRELPTVTPPLGLVFLGDENDRLAALQLLKDLNWRGPVLNLAGRLALWETAVALKETTCLLSNDSSLGHIAEAVDTPVAIMFGPTIESFGFAPRMRKSRAFSSRLGCRPCSKHGKIACRYGDKLCFGALPVDDIVNHLTSLLCDPEAQVKRRSEIETTRMRGGDLPSASL